MSVSLSHVDGPGDAELIAAVRGGDLDAYGELYARHVDAARRLGRQLTNPADADDLVSDAFTKVLTVLQRGGGPDLAFRAYLLTAVRRLHVDRLRAGSRLRSVDDLTPFDPGLPFHDTAVEGFDNAAAAKAFASLPERWQMVLWHTEVEGQKPADIAPMLGMSANSVAALAYRAREGLRQAFLSQHAADRDDVDCAWTRDHLGAYVRGGLSRRDAGKVDDHLADCRACAAVYLELTEVNSGLAGLLAPLLLGVAGTGYLSSAHGGAAAAATGGVVSSGLSGVKGWVTSHAPLTAVGGVAVTATALLAVYGVSHFNGHEAADAGGPKLQIPGASSGSQAPGPSRAVQPHRAGQTPRVVLGNPGPTSQPGTAPTATLPVAPASQASPGTTGPTGQPTGNPGGNPHGNPSSQPTQPSSPPTTKPTSPPPGAVTFTSRPPADVAIGKTYHLSATGGSGAIRFSVDPATTNAACSMLNPTTVSFDHAGTCIVAADQVGARSRTHASQEITVPQNPQTVTITSTVPDNAAVGGSYPVSATSSSGRPVTWTTNAACSISGTTVTFVHAQSCVVTATQAGDADLAAATDSQTVAPVARGVQTITFSSQPHDAAVDGTYAVEAHSSAGLDVTYSVDPMTTDDACSIDGSVVTFRHEGSCVIAADQGGNADYVAADTVRQTIEVAAAYDLKVTAVPDPDSNGNQQRIIVTVSGLPTDGTAMLSAEGPDDLHKIADGKGCPCSIKGPGARIIFVYNTNQSPTAHIEFSVSTTDSPDPVKENDLAVLDFPIKTPSDFARRIQE